MWPAAAARSINYGLSPEMGGMLGLRDLFVVAAPSSSFHHHHHHPAAVAPDPANPAATALGVGVIPLLSATPCIENETAALMTSNRSGGGRGGGGGIQLWQQEQESDEQGQYLKKHGSATTTAMFELNENFVQNENNLSVSGGGGGTTTCQDCGNQAKKDCSYRRCRTCCKSRNYDCSTHVRSTWVPEARRRERRLMSATAAPGGSSGATSGGSKKPRLVTSHQQQTTTTSHTSTSNTTPPRSFDTSSSHQDAGFKEHLPGQVQAPAVFKCVRVTAVDDGQDEFAYQAVVKIGGHVFKGFLYDQGVESRYHVYPNLSELHLGGGGGGTGGSGGGGDGGDGRNGASSPMLDPSDVYAGGGLLGGSTYGNPIN